MTGAAPTPTGWSTRKLFSDKYKRHVDVEYHCEQTADGRLAIQIKPATAQAEDSPHAWYEAKFVVEGEYVRAEMLNRYDMVSLKGVTHALLKAVASCVSKDVRSSLRLEDHELAEDASDQLFASGVILWERLRNEQRARYDQDERRYYLL